MSAHEILVSVGALALLLFCGTATLRASRVLLSDSNKFGEGQGQKVSAQVSLVVLPVVVTDRHGGFVSGLKEDEFHVYEDGKPQAISVFGEEDLPVTVGLVVDRSGSMRAKQSEVKSAVANFVETSNTADQIFAVDFNEQASLGLPASVPFTNNRELLVDAVMRYSPEGATALYDALLLAMEHLKAGTREKKALVLISDGGDNASKAHFHQVLTAAEKDEVLIYTIAILDEQEGETNPRILKELAKKTGARAYRMRSAEELPGICRQIAHELRAQYTLAYIPPEMKHDGGFHTIRVVVQAPGQGRLTVRTRKGYLAAHDLVSQSSLLH